ncbi:DUF2157 domain-containing protein [Catenuloplanes atrovinosus]|uniref:DUF2157 domain-containing protein n=1 Tax=Catenuloplanes atrovinosus TaxID=137266 RepID=A0AAE4C8C3_9ACTN|nr:DUF2157 domain-containing protein [Catenuloplanes atrovinosus]MDR7273629.1 hypothetical protein [Catenuloplanes atrovinosus]
MEHVPDQHQNGRLRAALDALVERGVLDRTQAGAVVAELAARPARRPEGLRRRLGEAAGYLGASLVLGATVLIVGEHWEELGRTGRVAVPAGLAVVLSLAGLLVRRRGAASAGEAVHRRLASTLLTGAAITAGFAAEVGLDDLSAVAWGATLGLTVLGYALARSAVGLLVAAGAACGLYGDLLDRFNLDADGVFGGGLVAMGMLWAVLAYASVVAERRFALAIAVILGLTGSQVVIVTADGPLTYVFGALVAAVCFAAYLRGRDWIALAGGVIGVTLVVPEFLYDITDGSLGPSGVMLIAGLTLLAGGLTGLHLRTGRPGPIAA